MALPNIIGMQGQQKFGQQHGMKPQLLMPKQPQKLVFQVPVISGATSAMAAGGEEREAMQNQSRRRGRGAV